MRATILLTPFMLWLMLVASCSSPPKPSTVDESRKRPVNSTMAVELQVCKSDLQTSRLLATEASRLAHTTATLAGISARQQAMANLRQAEANPAQGNSVYSVRFDYGSTRVEIAADVANALVEEAKLAPHIALRGRTDGTIDSAAESRIARDRARAIRDYLVAAGVEPSRIHATHQPTGDHAVDNDSATGRALNRRVEIEIYRALPVALTTSAAQH